MKKMKPMWTCGGVKLGFVLFWMFDLCCGTFIYGLIVLFEYLIAELQLDFIWFYKVNLLYFKL